LGLAWLLKSRSERLGTPEGDGARVEAEALLDRSLAEYGTVNWIFGFRTIGNFARPMRDEMRTLGVGQVAPPLTGEDLDGKPLSLASYRGKVVVISVWSPAWRQSRRSIPEDLALLESMKGRPFALLGLCAGNDRAAAKATAANQPMVWPSWWRPSLVQSQATCCAMGSSRSQP
jgi:hypothetical protein